MSDSTPLSADVPPGADAPGGTAVDTTSRVAQPSRALEIATAIAALAISAACLCVSLRISVRTETGGVDPRWWPLVLSGIGVTLSVLLLLVALARPPFERDDLEVTERGGWTRLLLAVVLSALYLVAWDRVGFILPTVLFLAGLLWVFGQRRPVPLIVFPVAMTAFIYGLFDFVLKVPL